MPQSKICWYSNGSPKNKEAISLMTKLHTTPRRTRSACAANLPSSGVTYHEVPKEYGATRYRYTVVNDRTGVSQLDRIVLIIE